MTLARSQGLCAIGAVIAMGAFALCAHREALLAPRFVALALAAVAMAWGMAGAREWSVVLGLQRPRAGWVVRLLACLALGAAMAVYYRYRQGRQPVPMGLAWFCVVSPLIGLGEEIVYRGFVQGSLRRYGVFLAILAAAGGHTLYKCLLFALPRGGYEADVPWLAIVTFVVGLAYGAMREWWGGLMMPAASHAVFDLVAYGDLNVMPWWVS